MSSFLDFAEEDDGALDALVASTISSSVNKLSSCPKKRAYEEIKNPFDSDSDSGEENDAGKVNEIISTSDEEEQAKEGEGEKEIQLLSSKEISDMKATSSLELDNMTSAKKGDEEEEAKLDEKELNRILGNMERTAKDGAGVPLVKTPSDMQAKLFPHQVVGLSWLYSHEYHNQGGMLCDDQGLGKTVEVIALMLKNPPNKFWKKEKGKELAKDYKTVPSRTLIIVPLSTLRQWEAEIQKFSGGVLKTAVHYGKERVKSSEEWGDADIILSTYGTMSTEIKIPDDAVDTSGKPLHNDPQKDFVRQKEDETGAQRVSRDWMEDSDSVLLGEEWYRIVCDESHIMKNYKTRTWLTASCLTAVNRWCLTGTPIHNSMDELYAQLAFVCVPEVENFSQWKKQISKPIQDAAKIPTINPDPRLSIVVGRRGESVTKKTIKKIQEDAKEAWDFLAEIVNKHILRRTKLTRNREGLPLVPLPKRTTKIKMVPFSPREAYEYHALYKGAKIRFKKFLLTNRENSGKNSSAFIHMIVLVTRLRQFCDHPAIVTAAYHMTGDPMEKLQKAQKRQVRDDRSLGSEDTDTEDDMSDDEVICTSEEDNKRYSFKEGLHQIIKDYVEEYNSGRVEMVEDELSNTPKKMPKAGKKVKTEVKVKGEVKAEKEDVKPKVKDEIKTETQEKKLLTYDETKDPKVWASSKMTALFEDLIALRHSNPRFKALVFSQFTTFLDIIKESLQELGFDLVCLDGRMKQEDRNLSIKRFTEEPNVQIFLISLRSGGLGLNLVAASHIFMTDFWWNPALEDQAIDRVHRIGQCAPVHVTRYCMAGSMEEQMLDMQEKKRGLSNGTFNEESQETKTLSIKDVMKIFGITEASMNRMKRRMKRKKWLFKMPRKLRKLGAKDGETAEEKRKRAKREELEAQMKEDAEAMESWQSFQDSTTETLIEVYTGKRLAAGSRVAQQQPSLQALCRELVLENDDVIEGFSSVASKFAPEVAMSVLEGMSAVRETQEDYLSANHSMASVMSVYGSKRGPSPDSLSFIPKLSGVQHLHIGSIKDLKEEQLLKIVESMPQLVRLVLPNNGSGVTNAVVKQISSLSSLVHLDLTCAYMVTSFDPLFSMWSIRQLILSHCPEARITNDDFSSLGWNAAANLEVLELSNCINLESTLSESAELGTIILESCSKGTVLFELFKVCANLRRLNLSGQDRFMLNDKTLKSICDLMHLEHVDMSDCGAVYYYDWFLKFLCTKLCKLKVLKLAFAQEALEVEADKPIPAEGHPASVAAREEKLKEEKEAREKLAKEKDARVKEGLGLICLLAELEELDLRGWTSLDDAGLQKIVSGCQKLRRLNLAGCSSLTSASLKLIANATDLETLNLSWCALDNDTVALLLQSLPNLTEFKIWACNKVCSIKLKEEINKIKLKGRDPDVWA